MRAIRFPALWVVLAGLYGCAAGYAWHLLPHGFPWLHPRLWTNEVLPVVIVGVAIAGIAGIWRKRPRLAAGAIAGLAGVPIGLAIGWRTAFAITGGRPAIACALIGLFAITCAGVSLRGVRVVTAIGGPLGILVGVTVPWCQRGADPATHPRDGVRALQAPEAPRPVALAVGAIRIEVDPMLRFISRSPDRGWTLFAPQRGGDEPASLHVVEAPGRLELDAETVVATPVYTHLNAFCTLQIRGHHRLAFAFSPDPAHRVEVMFSEYPVGKPSRFAFVDSERVFHVMQAASGEKGPFTELARGPLPVDAVLGITVFDDDRAIAQIDLADFAAQASTQLSPTAGWGVAENAIEFSLAADRPDASAAVFVTLAGTSVGRGWDSVGHAPGTYRDRISLRASRE